MIKSQKTMDMNQNKTRVYGLDVFRSFAILFVLVGHSFQHSTLSPQIKALGNLGTLGVELFFVLSGFLIGSIIMRLINDKKFHLFSDVALFWKRRWLRTLPLYFVALLGFLRFYGGRHDLFDYPAYFVFMQNFAYKMPNFFELSWSLAIEEHFYLWFPIVYLIVFKVIKRNVHLSILLTAIIFLIISYSFRLSHPMISDMDEYNRTIRCTVLSRFDAIMFGVLVAAMKNYFYRGFDWIKKITPVTATLFVMTCAFWFAQAPYLMASRQLQINLFTGQAIICALLLPWFDGLRTTGNQGAFFILTSKLSYSLYLVHIFVIMAVNKTLENLGVFDQIYGNPFILYPIYFTLFYFVSWITYHQIEKPFLQLRDIPFTFASVVKASWVTIVTCLVLVFVF